VNFKLGADSISDPEGSSAFAGLPAEAFVKALGGSIRPGRTALFVRVLGVPNLEILNVASLGVALGMLSFPDLVGEPFSATFIGDCGRLAGDWSSEAFKGALDSVGCGGGSDSLNGGRSIESPRLALSGEAFNESLNGDDGGRRAGLARIDPLNSWVTALLTVVEVEKSSLLAEVEVKMLPGGFTGLFVNGFMGVFSTAASSSSSELLSFAVAT
jgi:hypothetical protein